MTVYNTLGQRVTRLVFEIQDTGYYAVKWDSEKTAARIASGLYFVQIRATCKHETYSDIKKMIRVK